MSCEPQQHRSDSACCHLLMETNKLRKLQRASTGAYESWPKNPLRPNLRPRQRPLQLKPPLPETARSHEPGSFISPSTGPGLGSALGPAKGPAKGPPRVSASGMLKYRLPTRLPSRLLESSPGS